ncbi:MAG: hypothetical protein K6E10_12210 [Eubacterium sp.]|nr:hypothetical protein [Eubacterium sp.]
MEETVNKSNNGSEIMHEFVYMDMIMEAQKVSSTYSPLALAYIGDSVFDLLIKNRFVFASNMQPEKYHRRVTQIVSANFQSDFIRNYMDKLTEEEMAVYKRARNSSPHTKAKNASLTSYLMATGLEAVIGYLYMSGQNQRINEIINEVFEFYNSRQE